MTGSRDERHWLGADPSELDFFDLKGIVETILGRLHVTGAVYQPADHPTYQPGRTARLAVNGVDIGWLGELHPAVRQAFDLPAGRIAIAELDLEALLAQVLSTWFVDPISPYPAVLQDRDLVADVDDLLQPVADLREGVVPRDLLPFVFTSGAASLERIIQAPRMIVILHRIPSPRAAFGNRVGGLGSGKSLVRFHGDKPIPIHFRSQSTGVVTLHANDSF